ncbi:MAG: hypothetical protein ACE368_15630 [Paracoccaceae bacterium]
MFSNYGADLILGAFLHAVAVGADRGGARSPSPPRTSCCNP